MCPNHDHLQRVDCNSNDGAGDKLIRRFNFLWQHHRFYQNLLFRVKTITNEHELNEQNKENEQINSERYLCSYETAKVDNSNENFKCF